MPPKPYTPETLAAEWQCSSKHIRNLVNRGELRGFRIGPRLVRIPVDAVEEYRRCRSNIKSEGSTGDSLSHGSTEAEQDGVIDLTPQMRAELLAKRRESSQS